MKCGRYQSSTLMRSFCPASHTSRRDIGRTLLRAAFLPTSFAIANASSCSSSSPPMSLSTSAHGLQSFDCSFSLYSATTFAPHPSRRCSGSSMSRSSICRNAARYSSNVRSPASSFSANCGGSFVAAAISRSSYLTSAAWLSCMCSASRPRDPMSAAVLLCRMLCAPSQSAFILKLPPPLPMNSPA